MTPAVSNLKKSASFMVLVTWISGKRNLHDIYKLKFGYQAKRVFYAVYDSGIRQPVISMLPMLWVSGKAQSSCCLWFRFQTNAVSMTPMTRVSGKARFHAVYDLVFGQARFSGKRSFHDTYDLGFRQTQSP
jgi:hypothetical protein